MILKSIAFPEIIDIIIFKGFSYLYHKRETIITSRGFATQITDLKSLALPEDFPTQDINLRPLEPLGILHPRSPLFPDDFLLQIMNREPLALLGI